MPEEPDIPQLELGARTVFILGAGASSPYGFPLGSELKNQMIATCSSGRAIRELTKAGFDQEELTNIVRALRGTYHPTIDIFLEKKASFRTLGAHLIAFTLLPHEEHNALFPQNDWYGFLYGLLDFESETPDTSLISFVTLNYERSLEHFLRKNIDFNCPDRLMDLANQKLSQIEIVHAHGSLGAYPDVPYGQKPDAAVLQTAAERIRIVSDSLDDSDDFRRARSLICEAASVICLGFGYEPRTMAMLFEDTDPADKRVYGTSFQLTDEREQNALEFFADKIHFSGRNIPADPFLRTIFA